MKKTLLILIVLGICLGCNKPSQDKEEKIHEPSNEIRVIEDAYTFFVIGDWGRNGDDGQQELADMMSKVAVVLDPEFITTTGDNFYPNGVASVDDPYFISSYENIYKGYPLFVPWYVVLGNHDYRGNVQAQIDYTDRSRRWNMPARYYTKQIVEDEISAQLVFLDTNPLNDEYYTSSTYRSKIIDQDTTAQLVWMDSVISNDTSDWKIILGHHPMYTGGKREADKSYVRAHLEDRLNQLGAHVYFAGHEHDMQHVKAAGKMHHFVSGAGSEVRPTGMLDISLFAGSEHAFAAVSLTKDEMLVQFINFKGELMYSYSLEK